MKATERVFSTKEDNIYVKQKRPWGGKAIKVTENEIR